MQKPLPPDGQFEQFDPTNLTRWPIASALQAARLLAEKKVRIVLAESCTAGNVAGSLAIVPGISNWLCGSFVIYRNDSKARWLEIPRQLLDDPNIGPVSQPVTELLAHAALERTPEADLALAVTGHIGPGAPEGLDGHVFLAIMRRDSQPQCRHTQLQSPAPNHQSDINARSTRLAECTNWVLFEIYRAIHDDN